MAEFVDFNLNYEGMFGLGEEEEGEEVCSPALESGSNSGVDDDEDSETNGACNESLTCIDFDPVGRWVDFLHFWHCKSLFKCVQSARKLCCWFHLTQNISYVDFSGGYTSTQVTEVECASKTTHPFDTSLLWWVYFFQGIFGSLVLQCEISFLVWQQFELWAKGLSKFCLCSSDYTEGFASFKSGVEENSAEDLRFKKPMDEVTLNFLATKTFAENTKKKMVWAVTLYREWWYRRCNQNLCPPQIMWSNIEKPESLVLVNLKSALCSFVCEVRWKDGKEFPGEMLKQIIIMLQLYLEKQGLNFKLIDDPKMSKFRNTLDNLMKRCAADGIGHKESSLAIDLDDENTLWESNILGNSDPDQLRGTLFFLLGINFTLQGGEEHKNLQAPGFHRDCAGERYLQFKEDVKGKTHQGGLVNKVKPRTLKVYGSPDPSRNVVNLFCQNTRLLPENGSNPSLYKYALTFS